MTPVELDKLAMQARGAYHKAILKHSTLEYVVLAELEWRDLPQYIKDAWIAAVLRAMEG
jgi:hypothetical protein